MHDQKGRELKEGDTVLIPAKITNVQADENYCNASVQTIFGRRPDDAKENLNGINTAVMLRANEGDENEPEDYLTV